MFNQPFYPNYVNPMPAYKPQVNPTASAPMSYLPPQGTATNKIYVTGIEDVKARQLPNNSDYLFLDNDKPLIYRKVVDSTGRMEVQVFSITPYKEENSPAADMSKYVLKSDLEELKKELSAKLKALEKAHA